MVNTTPFERIAGENPAQRMAEIRQTVTNKLITIDSSIDVRGIYPSSILYLVYWYHRLHNNAFEQERIREHLVEYVGNSSADSNGLVSRLVHDNELVSIANEFVEHLLIPTKTVDLVIMKAGNTEGRNILCMKRTYYPFGSALPGGIILETDEDNLLNVSVEVFTALRVAAEKVLHIAAKNAVYQEEIDKHGHSRYLVRDTAGTTIRIYPEDQGGYHYSESPRSIYRPSDPRHIVDTIAFRCELEGEVSEEFVWRSKDDVLHSDEFLGGFAFGHHREIVAQITGRTSVIKQRQLEERTFVRGIIQDPVTSYNNLRARFQGQANPDMVSLPELFPVVDRLLTELFSEEINHLCEAMPIVAGVRDDAVIALRQVSLLNRIFCPYKPTIQAIYQTIQFFDLVARQKRDFFASVPKDQIIEHNPRERSNALYHTYRYTYRYNELLSMAPTEILLIPTFVPLSATDLLKVRGVPIYFLGLSTDFLYVDEFEQSPKEFFMHDANHSWRMAQEDIRRMNKLGMTRAALVEQSNAFIGRYMESIRICKTDTEQERELKKLKKIILFEVVHEDARPFLPEVIGHYIQQIEGGSVEFEVPRIDHETGYMDIIDTRDLGISTLSYVRSKLQHGFYDKVDAQLPQIVGPAYRTASWIAKAAYEMLIELGVPPAPAADLDKNKHVSIEWLLRRTCAVGPDIIHAISYVDPAENVFGDGAIVNKKRYQA